MTTQININTKSQLAKLIATENISIQHNQVKTASFDTVNRILTLPIFKVQSGDVYDMLIAHECSHALYTPTDGWKKISGDDELRSYVNVLEDCRIDKLIQKKYPGVVRNYLNGFDIMMKQNFFGLKDKDFNTDLMLIDKINLFYKSSQRLPINFSNSDNLWLKQVDKLKSFKDVVELAKKLLNWQKKEVEKMKKLPGFDNHILVENYNLNEKEKSENNINTKDVNNSDTESDSSDISNDEKSDEDGDSNSKVTVDEDSDDDSKDKNGQLVSNNAGGDNKLTVITDKNFEQNKEKLYDQTMSYSYLSIPDPKLNKIIVSNSKFVSDMKEHFASNHRPTEETQLYLKWLKDDFKKFQSDNKKTIMYLVKEFEMKKAATSYKRASQDKTGTIDPLKLKDYKFSDDIFKRLTIMPNEKNHGMFMLLDWSGSMCDVIEKTIHQLIQLVYFCKKVQIPFEVYAFSSERKVFDDNSNTCFNNKHGDLGLDSFKLINLASHKLKKTELQESLMYLYSMGMYYTQHYSRGYSRDYADFNNPKRYNPGMPDEYCLGNTPLNEAIVACYKLIPMFKNKYNIQKMTFITLTDGSANYPRGHYKNTEEGLQLTSIDGKPIFKVGKKTFTVKGENRYFGSEAITSLLLSVLKKQHDIQILGFYLIKRVRGHEANMVFGNRFDEKGIKLRKQFTTDKVAVIKKSGYNEYYIINAKDMNVENADLSQVNDTMKPGRIKQLFSKSMNGRIKSRVLLNKFIERVA